MLTSWQRPSHDSCKGTWQHVIHWLQLSQWAWGSVGTPPCTPVHWMVWLFALHFSIHLGHIWSVMVLLATIQSHHKRQTAAVTNTTIIDRISLPNTSGKPQWDWWYKSQKPRYQLVPLCNPIFLEVNWQLPHQFTALLSTRQPRT